MNTPTKTLQPNKKINDMGHRRINKSVKNWSETKKTIKHNNNKQMMKKIVERKKSKGSFEGSIADVHNQYLRILFISFISNENIKEDL